MYKHVVSGGCGIRPFIDLKLIEDNLEYDKEKLIGLAEETGMTKFTEKVFDLTHFWFSDGVNDETAELFSEYIFNAGIYGTFENQVAFSLAKNGNKFKNLIGRIFLSYDRLRIMYPILNKKPHLTPLYEVKRWYRIIFKDKMKHQLVIMKHNAEIDTEHQKKITKLMENLGIK